MREYVHDLISEVKDRMREAAAFSEEVFLDFCDQVVDEWLEYGQIHEDDDLEGLKSLAKGMWETVQQEFTNLSDDLDVTENFEEPTKNDL